MKNMLLDKGGQSESAWNAAQNGL